MQLDDDGLESQEVQVAAQAPDHPPEQPETIHLSINLHKYVRRDLTVTSMSGWFARGIHY